jgi:hypothetical protein
MNERDDRNIESKKIKYIYILKRKKRNKEKRKG